mmetsp:Transcript_47203/g.85005  ORF Transcript_47203/g.85005 Transcript_47203/m.85005 type:complete len:209 (-) Transcript_47203:1117-1743(-)
MAQVTRAGSSNELACGLWQRHGLLLRNFLQNPHNLRLSQADPQHFADAPEVVLCGDDAFCSHQDDGTRGRLRSLQKRVLLDLRYLLRDVANYHSVARQLVAIPLSLGQVFHEAAAFCINEVVLHDVAAHSLSQKTHPCRLPGSGRTYNKCCSGKCLSAFAGIRIWLPSLEPVSQPQPVLGKLLLVRRCVAVGPVGTKAADLGSHRLRL